MLSSWLCYHIKFPDSQLPSKALTYFNATNISMVEDRIQISKPKSLDMPFSFYSKEHKVQHQWFIKLIQNISKACNDIDEVNLCHMHSMLPALAPLQHSHKK